MQPTQSEVVAGQAIYTPSVLWIYDWFVIGISNRFIWKCSSALIQAHYNEHLSANHLEVGVGTGYFPDRSAFPAKQPRVGLMDMNVNTLNFASKRIARYLPETYVQNILQPISTAIDRFDSVGINYLLHCVPGSITEKAIAFDHLIPLMNPGAKIFGSTILQGDMPRTWAAQQLMNLYNKKGVFSNTNDTVDDLHSALSSRFDNVKIDTVGSVALFVAEKSAPNDE